ncbi:MAG: aspartate aminotransferase family protein [Oscillospiraceae bacterium]|jgi:acetylornithine/N-succinyldiaminopimelate aminotransferase
MDTKTLDQNYIANTYARFDLAADRGKGAIIFDENGKRYIDLGSGIAVCSFGMADDRWVAAVTNQLGKLQHMSNLFYTEPQAHLAKLLCEKTGMSRVFFCNSGAEANECAIKAARKYSSDKYGPGRSKIVTLINSFHGRTIATLSATGQDALHVHFDPFLPGFAHVPANDFEAMKTACEDSVCAIMLELVQGEGGVIPLDKDYVAAVAQMAAERDMLLIIDEVQTGNGRTGSLYAYMQYGIRPDIVTTAKGLAGGLPMGAALLGEKLKDTLTPGSHGSTFGGNPVCAAGAISVISRLDEEFLASVRAKGEYIKNALEGAKGVLGVTGMGLMLGIAIDKPAKETAARCIEAGVIVLTAHEKLRLLPPLNIGMEELREGIEILKGVLAQ